MLGTRIRLATRRLFTGSEGFQREPATLTSTWYTVAKTNRVDANAIIVRANPRRLAAVGQSNHARRCSLARFLFLTRTFMGNVFATASFGGVFQHLTPSLCDLFL